MTTLALAHADARFFPEAPIGHPLSELELVLLERRLTGHFQPILDGRNRRYIGFEGLMRGPEGSALRNPLDLLAAAANEDREDELERAALHCITSAFISLGLPGKLFLNVSPATMLSGFLESDEVTAFLRTRRLAHHRVVLEITESQRITDFTAFGRVVERLRQLGFLIALDDLGEGFSSLRLWSELRPDFVKIDKHFVAGVHQDALKFHLVRSIHEIAESCHATVIAEGVENETVLTTLRDMGIPCLQGFLVERPSPSPGETPSPAVIGMLQQPHLIVFPANRANGPEGVARALLHPVTPVAPEDKSCDIYERFHDTPSLMVLPVVDRAGVVQGILQRHQVIDRYARPFGREVFGRKPCTLLMDNDPVIVDAGTPLQEIGQIVARMSDTSLQDGFVITEFGRYLGVGRITDLVAAITELQIKAARYANPLTQLPGNVPLNEHADRLLANGRAFTACYADIDHFKPYNDVYGYRRGDDLIQLLGQILRENIDPAVDFIGHIGGDDFMLLVQSDDWEARCLAILANFDARRTGHLDPVHAFDGGFTGEDRRGQTIMHPIPSLSLAAVRVEAGDYASHRELAAAAAAAKRMAKRKSGSALFIERRRPSGGR